MITVGRSMGAMPDYFKARQAALRILELNERKSQINPHDQSGVILVCIFISITSADIR